uniref:Phosphotriesterase-related protein n=1 Tax=Culicoides sonorensis TaxID=179676 RepID=A0A336LR71_CULSO
MSIQTVLGKINKNELGITLTHEHLALNFEKFYTPAPVELENFIGDQITLRNVGFIKQYPYGSRFNLQFSDSASRSAVLRDLKMFKELGGGTIVENSSIGLRTDLNLKEISRETGVHLIAGAGFYLTKTQQKDMIASSTEMLYDIILNDFKSDEMQCGVIAEVGSDWPISDFERNAIVATAEAQKTLKCGVSFHPARNIEAPFEIIRLYLEAGGDPKKCVMSHLDRTLLRDEEKLFELAETGIYTQFDLFGTECSYYQLNPTFDMPSDGDRINMVIKLVKEGKLKQILISHDIHTKHRLTEFGGHGYHHIITNILPRMKAKGLDQIEIDTIIKKNPAEWLTIE